MKKFFNTGFVEIAVVDRRPFGLDDLTRYPLFAPEFIEFLRKAMPPHRHQELVRSLTVTASRPLAEGVAAHPS